VAHHWKGVDHVAAHEDQEDHGVGLELHEVGEVHLDAGLGAGEALDAERGEQHVSSLL
jgi:hypothetical protein